ncbi:MAG: AAA family ATPase [Candidatus Paceibacterota bacterium]|jgi:DNA polymerase-3 subunit delta'
MIFGHEDIQKAFTHFIREGTLGHAYLFFGDEGIGKRSFAYECAHMIERGKKIGEAGATEEEPLGDLMILRPNEKGTIGIDAVREVKHFLWQTPFHSPKRIALIDDAHALTDEAEGAMLKIVEEPPSHGLIILVTHDTQMLLSPLLSRLSRIYFRRFSRDEIQRILEQEYHATSARAKEIARASFGRLGRALSLLQGVTKKIPEDDTKGILMRTIEEKILSLYTKGSVQYAETLTHLLAREMAVKQFNINPGLQQKAVEYEARGTYN